KEEYIFKTIYNHDIKLVEINGSTIIVMFRWQDVKKSTPAIQRFAVTKDKLKLLFEGGINPHTVKSLKSEFAPYMQHNLSVFYAVYKKFYEFIESKTESKSIEEVEIIDDYSFEEIFEDWQLLNDEEKKAALETQKKYVLIIDEINRGNVSQIFGELITLIEDDKRMGCKEQLLLKLPYSKKEFGVPSNLYILGTMNTADRSVEALDTALRRRFVFEEMMPIPELLSPERMVWQLWWDYAKVKWDEEPYKSKAAGLYKLLGIESDFDPKEELWLRMENEGQNENQIAYFDRIEFIGINLQRLLEKINERIEILLSRDNLIGHSYFISVTSIAELKTAFQNKIIPLLQEYFFGDYGKIGLVLGSEFVEIMEDKDAEDIFADFEYEGLENFSEKKVYRLVDLNNFDDDEFINKVNSIF
ncbi:MAG: AAA family ATPase, partial [Ferruginibacter sp.]